MLQCQRIRKGHRAMNQAAKAAREMADEIAEYLRTLPPLKLQNVTLTGPIRELRPMYEGVAPASRRVGDPVTLFRLLEGPPRKTFGRGQLKLV